MGVETQRDRFTYHFDNLSSMDTPALIPHFFEQAYVADNLWLVARVAYTAGVRWETTGGVTPSRDATGTDYDTFFMPDGTVVVSGTSGGISIRSWKVGQRAELARRGSAAVFAGYRLRADHSDFQLGHKTVTRNGVIATRYDVTTREMTSSRLHEILTGFAVAVDLPRRWGVSIETEIAPIAVAWLLVQLPDKYPGQDLEYLAKVGSVSSHITLGRRAERWGLAFVLDAGRTWSYGSTATLSRRYTALGVVLTR